MVPNHKSAVSVRAGVGKANAAAKIRKRNFMETILGAARLWGFYALSANGLLPVGAAVLVG